MKNNKLKFNQEFAHTSSEAATQQQSQVTTNKNNNNFQLHFNQGYIAPTLVNNGGGQHKQQEYLKDPRNTDFLQPVKQNSEQSVDNLVIKSNLHDKDQSNSSYSKGLIHSNTTTVGIQYLQAFENKQILQQASELKIEADQDNVWISSSHQDMERSHKQAKDFNNYAHDPKTQVQNKKNVKHSKNVMSNQEIKKTANGSGAIANSQNLKSPNSTNSAQGTTAAI